MYCTNCGAQLNDNDKFCANCGTKVGVRPQNVGDKADSRCLTESKPKPTEKKGWKRFDIDEHVSVGKGLLLIVLGIIVCSFGWFVMDESTCYAWMKIRDSEYLRRFGVAAPSAAQWLVFAIGAIINITGIFYVYRTLMRFASRSKPLFHGHALLRKFISCIACAIIFVVYTTACAAVKARLSVWDYLIMLALFRIVWKMFVGNNEDKGSPPSKSLAVNKESACVENEVLRDNSINSAYKNSLLDDNKSSMDNLNLSEGQKGVLQSNSHSEILWCVFGMVIVIVVIGGTWFYVAKETEKSHAAAALKAFRAGDYERGVREAKQANSDNPEIKWYLGMAYGNGKGVWKDENEAFVLFRNAAEKRFPLAQLSLGLCYEEGTGVERDEHEAVKWFRKAAEQGFRPAQLYLSVCYLDGVGIERDVDEATKWCRRATEHCENVEEGAYFEQLFLGFCYEDGIGVKKDIDEAVRWYRKAARQGLGQAKESLKRLGVEE